MAHSFHFRTLVAFLIFMDLPLTISVQNTIAFLEYLYQNTLSPHVISTYLSSIQARAKLYSWDTTAISHLAITRYIRSININSRFNPTVRGIFDIHTLYHISVSCDILSDPILFRAIFLTAFFGFLRIFNIAPHSAEKFDYNHHFYDRTSYLHHLELTY